MWAQDRISPRAMRADRSELPQDVAPDPDTRFLEFLRQAEKAFDRAVEAGGGPCERFFCIGDRSVRLQFAGPVLVRSLTPALAHLSAPTDAAPHLTVRLWDTASTGIQPPAPPWGKSDYAPRGGIRARSTRVQAAFSLASGTLHALDMESNTGIFWVRDASHLPPWEIAAPLRTLFGWWSSKFGGQLAHAAAVGSPRGGLLLAARGGSGKSTTALACLESGMLYLGDDYVLLRHDEGPTVYSLYNSAKVNRCRLLQHFPNLEENILSTASLDDDKVVVLLNDSHRRQLARRLKLRGILIPQLSDRRRTLVRPASSIEVLKALAPTTVFQLPGAGADSLRTLGQIAEQVPGYTIEVGSDLDELVARIWGLLEAEQIHGS